MFYIDFKFEIAIQNNPLTTILINIEESNEFLSGEITIKEKVLEINLMNRNN